MEIFITRQINAKKYIYRNNISQLQENNCSFDSHFVHSDRDTNIVI
jgi:hypothetical protein